MPSSPPIKQAMNGTSESHLKGVGKPLRPHSWSSFTNKDETQVNNPSLFESTRKSGRLQYSLLPRTVEDALEAQKAAREMAFFLKNAGSPKPRHAPPIMTSTVSPVKKRSSVRFLRLGHRRSARGDGSATLHGTRPFKPIGVVEKLSTDGKKYFQIVPRGDFETDEPHNRQQVDRKIAKTDSSALSAIPNRKPLAKLNKPENKSGGRFQPRKGTAQKQRGAADALKADAIHTYLSVIETQYLDETACFAADDGVNATNARHEIKKPTSTSDRVVFRQCGNVETAVREFTETPLKTLSQSMEHNSNARTERIQLKVVTAVESSSLPVKELPALPEKSPRRQAGRGLKAPLQQLSPSTYEEYRGPQSQRTSNEQSSNRGVRRSSRNLNEFEISTEPEHQVAMRSPGQDLKLYPAVSTNPMDSQVLISTPSSANRRVERIRARKLRDLNKCRTVTQLSHGQSATKECIGFRNITEEDQPHTPKSDQFQLSGDSYTAKSHDADAKDSLHDAVRNNFVQARTDNKPTPLTLRKPSTPPTKGTAVERSSFEQSPPDSCNYAVTPNTSSSAKAANSAYHRIMGYSAAAQRAQNAKRASQVLISSEVQSPNSLFSPKRGSIASYRGSSLAKEPRLEARLEILERENQLLEAALMAVLKTSGRLNQCPCGGSGFGREGVGDMRSSGSSHGSGASALDLYMSTRRRNQPDMIKKVATEA